ncbi:MAG: FMN-dependent NADH-azoreductase [Alphaproteobacteria bacterium]
MNVLVLNSSSRTKESVSRQLVGLMLDKLRAENPVARVIERNLSKALPLIDEEWVEANFTKKQALNDRQKQVLAFSDALITELDQADILVFGVPLYNFSVPASLKLWIDLVCRAGVTFRYLSGGNVEGLLQNKQAFVMMTSGGVPLGSVEDHATPLMRDVLGLIGIEQVNFISVSGVPKNTERGMAEARVKIDELFQSHA